ncbi:MAG: hypothetical protein ABH877_02500 [bacterium]
MPDTDTTRLENKIDGLASRVGDLATACSVMDGKLDNVRLDQAAQAERWTQHAVHHVGIDKRLDGIEGREREDATGRIEVLSHRSSAKSDPPRKNGRVNGEKLKTWIQIGFGIGVGLLLVYNLYASPSKEDVEVAAERADSVASAAEKDLKENRKSREELQKVLQSLAPLAEMLETEVTP